MATFVDRLHDSVPGLECLTIRVDDNADRKILYFMDLVSSFKDFGKLTYLKLPQQILFGADNEKLQGSLTPINELLPTSIEVLEIEYSTALLLKFLDQSVHEHHELHLEQIIVYCLSHGGRLPFSPHGSHDNISIEWNEAAINLSLSTLDIRAELRIYGQDA
jgi:hypothetical protein